MGKFFAALIAICIVTQALAIGKEPLVGPHLSPAALAALHPASAIVTGAVPQTVQTCFSGYTLWSDGTCVKEVNEPAVPACPAGTAVGDNCEIAVPYLISCPPGFAPEAGICTRTQEVPPQYYCPKGFFDDGNSCAQTVPGEAVIQCDIGELVGNNCVSTQRADHLVTAQCPEGSQVEEDGNCWKIIDTFDCTLPPEPDQHVVAAPKPHVPTGKKVLMTKGKGLLRALWGKDQPIGIPPVLPPQPDAVVGCAKEMIAVTSPHPTKVGIASQVCNKKIQVDALALTSCPVGFMDNGEYCLQEIVTPATTICLSGGRHDGTCPPVTKRVPKYPGCPKTAFSSNGKCFQVDTFESSHSCARGFTDTGSACVGVVESPGWECPIGLVLEGDRCIGQKVRPPISLKLEPEVGCGKY